MEQNKKEDLRVRKTKEAIHNTFKAMICEMDYEQITIKELTQRAQINRKTFYLHYSSLDVLLEELQEEIADHFIRRKVSYSNMRDIRDLIRLFFEHATNMPLLHERLMCSGSYRPIWEKINKRIMDYRKETNRGVFGLDEYSENLVFAFYGANSSILFRQWVMDGKKLPLEKLIDMATKLICDGMSSIVPSE
ncbi:MAG: TetR/AcrR family transcriptional regulator [Clostridiales bacterium]|nr:TetR/AcrR family transcriptional regulator [Clostridiales bacterium]